MKKKLATGLLAIAMSSLFVSGAAQAVPCSTSSVNVTGISIAGGSSVSPSTFAAAECAGAYPGNAIPLPGTHGGLNLGYYGDGLFNGAAVGGGGNASFPNGIFYDQYQAVEQDLNQDGTKDPGWIYLGKWIPSVGFAAASIGGTNNIVLSSWFSMTQNAAGTGGTWSFTPDANVVSRAAGVLGNSLFDQFALSFMSGSTFAAYDFTGAAFGLPLSSSTIFNFTGSWDMSTTLLNGGGKAGFLSHVDLYARDPNGGSAVPEPGILALLGGAMMSGIFLRRRSAQK